MTWPNIERGYRAAFTQSLTAGLSLISSNLGA
jgi:hypothetical protein